MKSTKILLKTFVVGLILSLLTACANIPDIKPFADATALMASTMRKGYSRDEALMLRAIDVTSDEQSAKLQEKLKELKKVWGPTDDVLDALTAYSDALAALADAGRKGKETTGAFFNSLNGLVAAVSGLAIPANVVQIAQSIGGEIIALKAEKDLKKAVNSVANIISRNNGIADILAQNFAKLKEINEALGNDIEANLINNNRSLIDYHSQLAAGDLRVQRLLTKILEFEDIPNKLREQANRTRNRKLEPGETRETVRAEAQRILESETELKRQTLSDLKELDQGISASLSHNDRNVVTTLERRRVELLETSKGYRKELERIASDYAVVDGKLKEIRELVRSGNEIFDKSRKAIKAWAKAHDDLRLALDKKHKRVTVLGLLSIIGEIADALEKGGKNAEN